MQIKKICPLVIVLGLLSQPVHAQDSLDLVQAEQQLRNGQGSQVYGTLLPHEFSRSGDPDFDYLFGLAALEAGHPDTATLALERVLAVAPNHGAARLDMGRAYFALGDMQRARREFDLARKLNPPAAARATMDRYEAEITARETAPPTRTTAYIETGLGSDGNVTQGPNSNITFLPAFGVNFTMNTANQKKSDEFWQISGGAEVTHRLDSVLSLYGGIDAKGRGYSQVSSFDYGTIDLRGGAQWQLGADTWRAGLGYNSYQLAQQAYRNITSVNGEFRRAVTPRQQWMAFAQYAMVGYVPSAQINNNVNQWVAGVGWLAQVPATRPTLVNFSLYVGQEVEAKASLPRVDGDKEFFGLRAGAQMGLRADLDVFASAGLQSGNYQRSNALYLTKRTDTVVEAAAGAVWRFAPHWSLKPQLSWLRNGSNISVNDYERIEASVMVRRDF